MGITRILGNLVIYYNEELVHVNGFWTIESVGQNLIINRNKRLRNVDGFSGLEEVGGYLYVLRNPALENLIGFGRITTIGDVLYRGFPEKYLKNFSDSLKPDYGIYGIINLYEWLGLEDGQDDTLNM